MSKDNIIQLIQPGNVEDQLTEILRNGARCLLAQAVEAEVADFIGKHADLKTEDGHQRVVRHGDGFDARLFRHPGGLVRRPDSIGGKRIAGVVQEQRMRRRQHGRALERADVS